ncbi:MAG: DoxX family protein [Deltaproteobacteria bacterium]|nr:DoxX family protein [Deltaproteobacteria bacterium]MBI2341308.1 DoxX family protein [Deltaproteobacteria bacterium]
MILEHFRQKMLWMPLTLLRVSTGIIMTAHGFGKLTNIAQTAAAFGNMGIPYPEISVYFAIAGEFFGGLGLIAGFLTPIAAMGVFCVMVTAIVSVHLPYGLMAQNNGFEYPLTLLLISLFFIVKGAGPVSIDNLITKLKSR